MRGGGVEDGAVKKNFRSGGDAESVAEHDDERDDEDE